MSEFEPQPTVADASLDTYLRPAADNPEGFHVQGALTPDSLTHIRAKYLGGASLVPLIGQLEQAWLDGDDVAVGEIRQLMNPYGPKQTVAL